MGGPGARVLLRNALTEEQLTSLEQWLRSITSSLEGKRGDWRSFWITDGNLIGLPDDCHRACALGLSIRKVETEQDVVDKEAQAELQIEHEQFVQYLGFVPKQSLDLGAGCNRPLDHRMLGQLALLLAERYDGIIDLYGAIEPPLKPKQDWSDVTVEEVEQYVQELSFPGRIFHIYYITVNNTLWISHLIDPDFLRAWLQHPNFHMIK